MGFFLIELRALFSRGCWALFEGMDGTLFKVIDGALVDRT